MEMHYVDSSNVDQIGFDEAEKEVHVIFKKGDHYVYSDVSQDVWEAFRNSVSKGSFIHQEFRSKGYSCRKR